MSDSTLKGKEVPPCAGDGCASEMEISSAVRRAGGRRARLVRVAAHSLQALEKASAIYRSASSLEALGEPTLLGISPRGERTRTQKHTAWTSTLRGFVQLRRGNRPAAAPDKISAHASES